jgi:tartrate dehydratase beta subunit/fumarate hydratase class I family protein
MKIAISKHRQFDPDTGKWIEGKVIVGRDSSLRKLMRAAKRGKLPFDRLGLIEDAAAKAAKRAEVYMHSHARGMKKLREVLAMRRAS